MGITTEEQPNGTGGYFDAGDIALGVSYAKYLADKFSVGANVPLGGSAVYFDYAFSLYDILPSVHRISVNLSF